MIHENNIFLHCSQSLSYLGKVMLECYHADPAVRPSALRLKKSLSRLLAAPTVPGNPIKMVWAPALICLHTTLQKGTENISAIEGKILQEERKMEGGLRVNPSQRCGEQRMILKTRKAHNCGLEGSSGVRRLSKGPPTRRGYSEIKYHWNWYLHPTSRPANYQNLTPNVPNMKFRKSVFYTKSI